MTTAHADVHAIPADTQLVHVESTGCICQPAREGRDVWIHRPLDVSPPKPPPGAESPRRYRVVKGREQTAPVVLLPPTKDASTEE